MHKDFDGWNEIKKKIELEINKVSIFPKTKEVWICTLGKNIGIEQNGGSEDFSRPVLIVKKFNNKMFWCVPLSTKQKDLDFYYNFSDSQNRNVSAVLAQMRLVSIKRFKRKLYDIPEPILKEIKIKLREFLL